MKKFIYLLLLCPLTVFGQLTDAQLTIEANSIKNSNTLNSITPTILGNMLNHIIDNKHNKNVGAYVITTGIANAYIANPSPVYTSYYAGMRIKLYIHAANTGASTVNVNSLGIKNLKRANGAGLSSGDLAITSIWEFVYDGTDFKGEITSGSGGGGGDLVSTNNLSDVANTSTALSNLGGLSNSLLSTKVFVGNSSNIATGVNISGDGTISNTGVFTLANTAVVPGSYTSTNITVDSKGRILTIANGSGGGGTWGSITGTLSSQTDLQTALNAKGIGDLLSTNNLSELTSPSTARTNLGLAIGTNVQAYSSKLGNFSALANSSGVLTNDGAGNYSWGSAGSSGTVTSIATTSPITGGTITTTGTIGISDAAADGSTKGAASFTASDFDATSGNIAIDYTNGQVATNSVPGFLSAADHTSFAAKQSAITLTTTGTSGAATFVSNILNIPQYAGTTYNAGTGLTLTTGTFSVNTSQNISTLSNLTSNGFLKTSGGAGTLGVSSTVDATTELSGIVPTVNGGTGVDNSTGGTANQFWARPNGSTGAATYRAIVAADIPTLNQNTTGSAATLATARTINTVPFNGSANISIPGMGSANRQTASYTLVLGDANNVVEQNVASSNTLTVPPNSSVAFPINTQITLTQYGVGLTTVVAGSGVTIRSSSGGLASPGQYFPMVLWKVATDEWYLWNGNAALTTAALTKTDDTNVTLTLGGSPSTALNNATSLTLGWTGSLAVTRGGTGITSISSGDILYGSASNTLSTRNILNTSPASLFHLKAGSATANTAPLQFTSGPVETTIRAGIIEYNNAFYHSNSALNRYGLGGVIQDFTSDAANSGTSETDLYTYTTKASTLSATGEKLTANFITISSDVTASSDYKIYFGGTQIYDSGVLGTTTGTFNFNVTIIRTGSTTARSVVICDSSVTAGTSGPSVIETDLTGLTFTNTNIIKITGQAGGAGGGSSDLTAKLGSIEWKPSANN